MKFMNINECGDTTEEFLLCVGMLLRNFNEHGDAIKEFL